MIVVFFGLPGSGKSFLAEKLSKYLSIKLLSSDRLRVELSNEKNYSRQERDRVYQIMFEKLKSELIQNKSVVLDATFSKEALRREVQKIAIEYRVNLFFIEVMVDEEVARERLSKKRDFSDADYKVYLNVKMEFETMNEPHLVLENNGTEAKELISRSLEYIDL